MQDWTLPGVHEVAPGVHRIPLPLPNDGLHAVNVYAIEDGDGVVLVDSGWALQEAQDLLERSLGELGRGFEDVTRFLVTHVHRDHYTMAVHLRRLYGSRIALGIGEQPSMEQILNGQADTLITELYRWGAPELARTWAEIVEKIDRARLFEDYAMPDEWLTSADIELEKRVLTAVPTPGHTRGHVVFVDRAAGLMFSGDHVLPHITPSIGFEPVRPELPLADYMESLRMTHELPDMRMLPAHGPVADSVHTRVDELLTHHEERLVTILAAVRGTAYETARNIGWTRRQRRFDELDLFNQVLAVGETAAHLDVLVKRGELRANERDGVLEYLP